MCYVTSPGKAVSPEAIADVIAFLVSDSPRDHSPRYRSPGLWSGMRTEPPSLRRPVPAGSASRHVITAWEKSAATNQASPGKHHVKP